MPHIAVGGRFAVVRIVVVALIFMFIHEQALMGFGLNQQENAVHGGRDKRDQQRLSNRKVRLRQRHRKYQHNNRQREQGNKILFDAKQVHILGGKFTPAEQQRKANQPAGDNHNDGVERVTHQRRRGVARRH